MMRGLQILQGALGVAGHSLPLYLAVHIIVAGWAADNPGNAAEFYSVVERNGTVLLCLSKGSILFSDRCAGDGRLTIVEPIKEGAVVWRSATGTVSLENQTPETANSKCLLSHAKWDPKAEQVVSTGKKITKADRTVLLNQLKQGLLLGGAELIEDDITAFALDLDNDGKQEIMFTASNLTRVARDWERDKKTRSYVILAGIMPPGSRFPALFYRDHGDYLGGTDTIGSVTLRGVVSISPGTGEIALLITTGGGDYEKQTFIRYRYGAMQKIETIQFSCG